jgi:hypothetical protein
MKGAIMDGEPGWVKDPALAAALGTLGYKLLNAYENAHEDGKTVYMFDVDEASGVWIETIRAYWAATLHVNARAYARYLRDLENGKYFKNWTVPVKDVAKD